MIPRTAARTRRYNRFCPLSLTLDQVGERWTLHIILALMSGPKRYSELKRMLAGAGANILSERLRQLSANDLVGRTTGNVPGSDTTYHLTERGRDLGPVVGSLMTYGLYLLMPPPQRMTEKITCPSIRLGRPRLRPSRSTSATSGVSMASPSSWPRGVPSWYELRAEPPVPS